MKKNFKLLSLIFILFYVYACTGYEPIFSSSNFQFEIINYENEHFKHYGFVDKNRNVWDEEFEDGSIQRTKTLYFTLSYLLY